MRMVCPRCGHDHSKVLKTEHIEEHGFNDLVTRRRHRCLSGSRGQVCERTFVTFEISKEDFELLKKVKQGGHDFVPSGMISTIEEGVDRGTRMTVKPRKPRKHKRG